MSTTRPDGGASSEDDGEVAAAVERHLAGLPAGLEHVRHWVEIGRCTLFIARQEGSGFQPTRTLFDRWYSEYERRLEDAVLPPGEAEAVVELLRQIRPGDFSYGSSDALLRARQRLRYLAATQDREAASRSPASADPSVPPEIAESLERFRRAHPDAPRLGFIMMRFGDTPAHAKIVKAIRKALAERDLVGLRADDQEFHPDLFSNVLTYIHGCSFGIAVFERLETEHFNPNVALEVGYMNALRKPVCLLKDRTLATLPTDLIGKLYRDFDPQRPLQTIPPRVQRWLDDRGVAGRAT